MTTTSHLTLPRLRSDTEEERGCPSRNGQSGRSEFKDEEETVTTKSVHIVQATETTATRKKGGVPSKTVDLGAAAHYTGDKSPAGSTKQVSVCVCVCLCVSVCVCVCVRQNPHVWCLCSRSSLQQLPPVLV